MLGPSLVIETVPPLVLLSVGDAASGLAYPLISGIGAIHKPADGSETANVDIGLDNADGAATALFSDPPLRSRAILYGPNGDVWFSGLLAGVRLSESAMLALES